MATQKINATVQVNFSTITPPTITGDLHNWNPTGFDNAFVIRCTVDSNPHNITGIAGGFDGRIIVIENDGEGTLTFVVGSVSSSDGNRFDMVDNISMEAGDAITFKHNGISWRCIGFSSRPGVTNGNNHDHNGGDGAQIAYSTLSSLPTIREVLAAARTYYVRTDGNDSNTGLANTASGAFLTIQKAVDTVATLDVNGQTVTIQVADGTYTGAVSLKNVVGFASAGNLVIQGNNSTPSNVVISTTNADAFTKNSVGSIWDIRDLKITTTTSGHALIALNGGTIRFQNLNFGAVPNPASAHIRASLGGNITATGNYAVSGGGYVHMWTDSTAYIFVAGVTITFSNSPVFAYFSVFETLSFQFVFSLTFTNGNTVTGQRHLGTLNAAVQTNGTEATYFPGNSAGARTTGAQWG